MNIDEYTPAMDEALDRMIAAWNPKSETPSDKAAFDAAVKDWEAAFDASEADQAAGEAKP